MRKSVATVLTAFFPAVILTGTGHINYLVDRILALPLGEGCVSSLHYAWKLILLPVSLLSVAFATPLLTFLSQHEARKEREKAGRLFERTTGTLLFLAIPVTFLLLLTRKEIVGLFYGWGRFDKTGISLTSSSLFYYSPGLPFQLLLPLCVAGFLAIKKPWIPVWVSLPLVPLNWFLDQLLMQHFAHAGIALSTSVIFFINVSILYCILQREFHPMERIKLIGRHTVFLLTVVILFYMIWWVYSAGSRPYSPNKINIIIELIITGMITIGGYLLLAHACQIQVMRRLTQFLRRTK
jgi:putative peptidoglycan lipid II flippase